MKTLPVSIAKLHFTSAEAEEWVDSSEDSATGSDA